MTACPVPTVPLFQTCQSRELSNTSHGQICKQFVQHSHTAYSFWGLLRAFALPWGSLMLLRIWCGVDICGRYQIYTALKSSITAQEMTVGVQFFKWSVLFNILKTKMRLSGPFRTLLGIWDHFAAFCCILWALNCFLCAHRHSKLRHTHKVCSKA